MRDYQYETSPRKLNPEYTERNRKRTNQKKVTKTASNKNARQKARNIKKFRALLSMNFVILFMILFTIIYRNSLINQSFSQIQSLKSEVTEIKKENDQIEIGIQNSLNANNLEQAAKDLLGMQKLTSKQTVYINLPKKDYVEPSTEQVILEEDLGFWANLFNKIKDLF